MMPARLKAFCIHLMLSVLVALAILVWVLTVWYPSPLHQALGVGRIFVLLVFVDVVLGPILTLLVYKASKKTLFFDLAIIVSLQVSALAYGFWTVAEGRPAWLVFNVDRFDVVQVADIDERHIDMASPEFQKPSWFGPQWAGADLAASEDYSYDVLFESVLGGPDIAQRPFLYRPLSQFKDVISNKAQPLTRLTEFNDAGAVANTLADKPQASGWLPLMARAQPMVVLLKEDNTEVLGIVALNPWP